MAGETLTEEQVTEAEMNRFSGGSTTDGEPSDGESTADENAVAEAAAAESVAAKAAAAANEATRKAAEAKAAGKAGVKTPPEDETDEEREAREAEEAAALAAKTPAGKKTVQQRINEQTRAQRTAERERDAALQELADLKAGRKPLTPPAAGATSELVAPDPKDFEFGEMDVKFISALARYEVKLEMANGRKTAEDERKAEAQAVAVTEFQARVDAFADKGAEKFDDFKDLVIEGAKAGDWDLTATVGELILESDFGHEIAHYLASNPEEATRIAQLPPSAQAAKFGRLEAKFEAKTAAQTSAQADPKSVKTSKTPPPPKTPRSNAGQFQVDGSTKDFAAFEALAKAG